MDRNEYDKSLLKPVVLTNTLMRSRRVNKIEKIDLNKDEAALLLRNFTINGERIHHLNDVNVFLTD